MYKIASMKTSLRFRRWSRKRCAVFCSIGREVTIGCLKKNIIESSLPKQRSVALVGLHTYPDCDRNADYDDGGGGLLASEAWYMEEKCMPIMVRQLSVAGGACCDICISKVFTKAYWKECIFSNMPFFLYCYVG